MHESTQFFIMLTMLILIALLASALIGCRVYALTGVLSTKTVSPISSLNAGRYEYVCGEGLKRTIPEVVALKGSVYEHIRNGSDRNEGSHIIGVINIIKATINRIIHIFESSTKKS